MRVQTSRLLLSGDLSTSGVLSIDNGATLELGGSETLSELSGLGSVDLGSHSLTLDHTNNYRFEGDISGTGVLTKSGTGTLTLGGVNTYSGGTTISAGRLLLSGDLSTSGVLSIDNGATLELGGSETLSELSGLGSVDLGSHSLTLDHTNNYRFEGDISGTGVLTKSGTGTLTLGGVNTYSGGTTISAGTLSIGIADNIGTGVLTLNSGILQTTGMTDIDLGSRGVMLGSGGGTFNVATSQTLSLGGAIGGTGVLTKSGTGTLTLGGVNTYSGGTTISAGRLLLSGDLSTSGVLSIDNGATLELGGSETLSELSGLGSVDLGSHSLTLDHTNNYRFEGDISGTGVLTKSGTGTLTLGGVNTYSGGTTISAGTLSIGIADNIGTGVLTLNSGILQTTGMTDIDLGSRGVMLGSGGGTFNVATSQTLSLGGAIGGTGVLTKSGTGTLTLGGVNTYSGH